jgi:2-C-methyl-D-erythritol 2,4-cyclodiphosphate synthase
MLERFTEKARRVIFYSRYEASQYGSPYIESFHLLLGLMREEGRWFHKLGPSVEKMRETYESRYPAHPRISTSIEVPLSDESKRILVGASEEADRLNSNHVGSEHILLAMFSESDEIRTELEKLGLTKDKAEKEIASLAAEPGRHFYVDTLEGSPSGESSRRPPRFRVCSGIGYDLHRLEAGRKLMIGGVEVPFDKGPVGHSDGDVLIHAICDALLGAAGMGDIGTHFPDNDPKWKGANSILFLEHIQKLLAGRKTFITHIDAVVIMERPKLGPHFPAMQKAIARALGIETNRINLKAKTNEGVDAVGRGEAIAAHVVANVVV